jgi:hypothetical protein
MKQITCTVVITLNAPRTKAQQLATVEMLREAMEERMGELCEHIPERTQEEEHRIGHIGIEVLGEVLEICGT